MRRTEPQLPPRAGWVRIAPLFCLAAILAVHGHDCPRATAQTDARPTLVLTGVNPGGVRLFATESWATFDVHVTNRTGTDRLARVLMFYQGHDQVQYGRDLWVPAHATLSTWMLVGPAAAQPSEVRRDVQFLLYDRSGGKDERVEDTQERLRSRRVLYRQREPFTAILLDEEGVENVVFGELPKPPSQADEALLLARTFRSACNLSEHVSIVQPGALPPLAEAFDGVDHFVLASERIAQDPSGMQALRQWLERGGSLWVLLDMVAPDAIAPLLGGALDFDVVDRVSLTAFAIESQTNSAERLEQRHERPVEFVRVLLPKEERVEHTVNGWPAWFTRQVGRGKVVFTTLGPRAWFRARQGKDRPSPYTTYPGLPLPMTPLQQLADELHPGAAPSSVAVDELRPLLADEIGYVVVGRGSLALVLATFLLVALALGIALRRSRRPELLGWLGPAAAVGAAAVLFVLGESGRRSAAPTVAVAQLVDAVSGTEEATVRGLLAAYRPDSGTAKIGAANGGSFDLDMAGLEGQSRRLVFSDRNAWHWDNLALPAGVRFAPFQYTAATKEPLVAVARFGPEGLEGKLAAGPFLDLTDALLSTPADRALALRVGPDGRFTTSGADILPSGRFLAAAVLSNQQQRRQDVYRKLLHRTPAQRGKGNNVVWVWAKPVAMHFDLGPARLAGSALLAIPLQLVHAATGERVTIPGPLISCARLVDGRQTPLTLDSNQGADMDLRFQLPDSVLPLTVERARLSAKIHAPARRVTIAGRADRAPVELHRVDNPMDPLHVDIDDARLLGLDRDGGLFLTLTVSESFKGTQREQKWAIDYLELEVSGHVIGGP